ncbi:hypothetical protein KIN20_028803 [Parelaphostrongylus tenuis]|uniref:Ribosomal RNA-processing protein 7 C-terminal domain-containing protein n=1 Tax=Parelaphostrongylus tenuis TaxID=148309 RepID=A0AAD5R1M1_PARTN|nr:hypothetical protein KIN20_028803 [Parelaphostrongylus tenuis]
MDEVSSDKSSLKTATRKRLKKKKEKKTEMMSVVKKEDCEARVDDSIVDPDELKYLRYSIDERYSAPRQLFLKADKSNEFSLIVANVPAYLPKDFVGGFISQFVNVPIKDVVVKRSTALDGSKLSGQLTLSVLFKEPRGVSLALAKCQDVGPYRVCDFCDVKMPSVLQSSVESYRRMFQSPEEIEKAVAEFMKKQDEEAHEIKRIAKRKFTEPDEEGWITVTKAAKKVGKAIKLKKDDVPLMGGLRKRKNHVDLAFYSFDKKNAREKKLNELREKFLQDKKRIALLKNARKFNPD